jgi:hypothetical protein
MTTNKTQVSYFVKTVNELIDCIEKSSKNIFETFHSAYKTLTTSEFENEFIPAIKMDNSSINKMKKICKSDFITRNRDKLPKSWANLYALVNIDEDDLQGFVDDGVVTTETTKKQIMEIREKIEPPINEDEFENLMDETNSELIEDSNDGTDDNSVKGRDKHWVGMSIVTLSRFTLGIQHLEPGLTKKRQSQGSGRIYPTHLIMKIFFLTSVRIGVNYENVSFK